MRRGQPLRSRPRGYFVILRTCAAVVAAVIILAPAASAAPLAAEKALGEHGPKGMELLPISSGLTGATTARLLLKEAGVQVGPDAKDSDDGYRRTWSDGQRAF